MNREPATFQEIVLRAAPTDLMQMRGDGAVIPLVVFMDAIPPRSELPPAASPSVVNAPENVKAYTAASPIAHVSASSPPVLLLHGDADTEVPFQQSVAMEAALRAANVPTKLIRVPGGGHGADFAVLGKPNPAMPNAVREMVDWFNRYLKPASNDSRGRE